MTPPRNQRKFERDAEGVAWFTPHSPILREALRAAHDFARTTPSGAQVRLSPTRAHILLGRADVQGVGNLGGLPDDESDWCVELTGRYGRRWLVLFEGLSPESIVERYRVVDAAHAHFEMVKLLARVARR